MKKIEKMFLTATPRSKTLAMALYIESAHKHISLHAALEQSSTSMQKVTMMSHCAVCHGIESDFSFKSLGVLSHKLLLLLTFRMEDSS